MPEVGFASLAGLSDTGYIPVLKPLQFVIEPANLAPGEGINDDRFFTGRVVALNLDAVSLPGFSAVSSLKYGVVQAVGIAGNVAGGRSLSLLRRSLMKRCFPPGSS